MRIKDTPEFKRAKDQARGFRHADSTLPVEGSVHKVRPRDARGSDLSKRAAQFEDGQDAEGRHGVHIKGGSVYGFGADELAAEARQHFTQTQQGPGSGVVKLRAAGNNGNSLPRKEHRNK
jgi:hypothetical protein